MLYRRNLDCFSNSVNKKYVDNFCEIAKIFTVLADWALSGKKQSHFFSIIKPHLMVKTQFFEFANV